MVKGEIKGRYDEKLEFDMQVIDFKDFKQLISRSSTRLYIESKCTLVDQLYLHDDIISLTNGEDVENSY